MNVETRDVITERESREEDAATNERFRLGYDACEEVAMRRGSSARYSRPSFLTLA